MDRKFWKNKTVLITGHTGFKGSWLVAWLSSLGAKVIGYALAPYTDPNMFELLHLEDHITSIIGDIRDLDKLSETIQRYQPEIIIHMAAQPLVRYAYAHPIETYEVNVLGTAKLFEAARHCESVKVIVNVTTDKCYENKEWERGYRETDRLGGYDPYSNSKACSELVTAAYRSSYFNPKDYAQHGKALASARAGNVIGGGDWSEDRLIPDMIRAFVKNETVFIRNPSAIRPWQHVLEPLHGYLLLAENMWDEPTKFAEGWNFGPFEKDAKSVEWIVNYLVTHWGDGAAWEKDGGEHPHEATYLKLDIAKAQGELKWQPCWQLEQGLDVLIAWYQAWTRQENMFDVTMQQIKQYEHNLEEYLS